MCDRTTFADSCLGCVFSRARRTQVSCMKGYQPHQTLVFFPALKNQKAQTPAFTEMLSFTSDTLPARSLFTLFSSSLFQRQVWPELDAKPEDSGQTQTGSNGWRTTGAPSKCHSCLKLADSFPQLVLPTHRQWKDQMCLCMWIKNMHDVLSMYDKTTTSECDYR